MLKLASNLELPFEFSHASEVLTVLQQIGWAGSGCGSDHEPLTTRWCESLDRGMGNPDVYRVVDWGCGYGRFLNYLLLRNVDLTYYGFEIDTLLLEFNKRYLPLSNERQQIKFGHISQDELVAEAINHCDTLLLGSVFTHLTVDDSISILKKFEPLLDNGGQVVFSLIMGDEYRLLGNHPYYSCVFHTEKELNEIVGDRNLFVSGEFQTNHTVKHIIYRMS